MTDLSVELLGPFGVRRDGEPIALGSRRTEALFAYLVHTGTVHRREHLVELLWGEGTTAAGNLRVLLTNLRKTVGDFVEITRTTAAFRPPPSGRAAVDVQSFNARSSGALGRPAEALAEHDVRNLRDALRVCRGPFLEGLDLGDTARFDDWLRGERELLLAQRVRLLVHLIGAELAGRQTPAALRHGHELRNLRPLDERSHQLIIQALLQAGDVDGATAQFDRLERMLDHEFGSTPSAQTRLLFAAPTLTAADPAPVPRGPHQLRRDGSLPARASQPWSTFVGRTAELATITGHGSAAAAGQGRVVFVTGGVGSGKTSLTRQSVRRLLGAHPEMVALGGTCSDAADSGGTGMLLVDLLGQLAGQSTGPWLEGPMPVTVSQRIQGAQAGWSAPAVDGFAASSAGAVLTGLRSLAEVRPVVLVLDNLQWASPATVNLLSELAKDIRRRRLLVIASLRPEPIRLAAERATPVPGLVARLRRVCGAAVVDLEPGVDSESATAFVRDLVRSESADLPVATVRTLRELGGGSPLVTAELLRQQVRDGRLVRSDSRLVVRSAPLWSQVPDRVALAFSERLAPVTVGLWPALHAAAALGEEFDAHDVARLCDRPVRAVVEDLAINLGGNLGLVESVPGTTCYRFRPRLLRLHLLSGLDDAQRAVLRA